MPVRPGPNDPRRSDYQRDYINWIRANSSNIEADIAEVTRKWQIEDYERSKYDQFQAAKQYNRSSNPKYADWIAECEAAWNDSSKPAPLDFPEWMQFDKNVPRIRTENPPRNDIEEASSSGRRFFEIAGIGLIAFSVVVSSSRFLLVKRFSRFLLLCVVPRRRAVYIF